MSLISIFSLLQELCFRFFLFYKLEKPNSGLLALKVDFYSPKAQTHHWGLAFSIPRIKRKYRPGEGFGRKNEQAPQIVLGQDKAVYHVFSTF